MVQCRIGIKSTRHSIVDRLRARGHINAQHRITSHGIIAANVFMRFLGPLTSPLYTSQLEQAFALHIQQGKPLRGDWLRVPQELLSRMTSNSCALRNFAYSSKSVGFQRCEGDSNPRKNRIYQFSKLAPLSTRPSQPDSEE